MTSKEQQRFEQVTKKIAESEKPKKHAKEKNVEATIAGLKEELSHI